ncbi:MAG: hypothetical protein NVSMB30_04950 [Hymenobacter sp.]
MFSTAAWAQLPAADEKAVREVANHWMANLNNHRFQEMTGYTTQDISFTTPVGMHWRGQQQVVKGHEALFERMYKGVPFKGVIQTVRSIAPDVALVDETTSIGISYPPDGVNRGTNKAGPWRAEQILIMVKKHGQWLVAAGAVTGIDEKAIKSASAGVAATKARAK